MRKETKKFELVVIGGGISGVCAAVSAARLGVKTALVQNRPVLGGNASSEIKMHICGADCHGKKANARETGIVEEISLKNKLYNPSHSFCVQDALLWELTGLEQNLTLYVNTHIHKVYTDGSRVTSVKGIQQTTEREIEFLSDFFADMTGDGFVAAEAGANIMCGRESRDIFNEPSAPKNGDNTVMGSTLLFTYKDTGTPQSYKKPDFAYSFTHEDMKMRNIDDMNGGYWWIELGETLSDIIHDGEKLQAELLKTVFGVWDYMKNSTDGRFDNYVLDWVGFLSGRRESRRVKGDYIMTQKDITDVKFHYDDVAYGGWPMDVHTPGGFKAKGKPPTDYIHFDGIYGIPYRCLYAENLSNLFIGGRAVSSSHLAFSSMRVMGTCGVIGQAVGTAAYIANKNNIKSTREILKHIRQLQQQLLLDDCFIPQTKNEDEKDLALTAAVNIKGGKSVSVLTDGISRNISDENHLLLTDINQVIEIKFADRIKLNRINIKFDSDLSTELCNSISSVVQGRDKGFPKTLVKKFKIELFDGKEIKNSKIYENCIRNANIYFKNINCDKAEISVLKTYGAEKAHIFELRAYGEKL